MASWRAAFAPFLRGAFQVFQPGKTTIVKEFLPCKHHYVGGIRNMATFERKKPHVNIGMYTDEADGCSIGRTCWYRIVQVLLDMSITEKYGAPPQHDGLTNWLLLI